MNSRQQLTSHSECVPRSLSPRWGLNALNLVSPGLRPGATLLRRCAARMSSASAAEDERPMTDDQRPTASYQLLLLTRDSAVQGLVESSLGLFVFRRGNLALLALNLKLKELLFQRLQQEAGVILGRSSRRCG